MSSTSSSSSGDDENDTTVQQLLPLIRMSPSSRSSSSPDSIRVVIPSGDSGSDAEEEEDGEGEEANIGQEIDHQEEGLPPLPNLFGGDCVLCTKLRQAGFDTAAEVFPHDLALAMGKLPEKRICACPGELPQAHMICLQRWIRLTGDRPCPDCRVHFEAPSHLTRLDDFFEIMGIHYGVTFVVTMWLLNVWLLKDLLWAMITEWERFDFTEDRETFAWIVGNVRWSTFLFMLVPFMNLFVLQYFYLLYQSVRADLALIQFSYSRGGVEATQLYGAQMVAEFNVRRGILKPGILNYGALWHVCSYCGQELQWPPARYLRYICNCYGWHNDCLRFVLNTNPAANPQVVSSSKCPNCAVHFNFGAKPLLCVLRDALLQPLRTKSIRDYLRQLDCALLPSRVPSFKRYLFATELGRPAVLKFAAVLGFYLVAEVAVAILQHTDCTNLANVWRQVGPTLSPLNVWLLLRLLWFTSEFSRLAYRHYLADFDLHQRQLQSHIDIPFSN